MLQAMNTGHDGSMSTCHANGTTDALRRIETMALTSDTGLPLAAVREQLLGAIDLLVHVVRGAGGARRVSEVAEVVPAPTGSVSTRRLALGPRFVDAPTRAARRASATWGPADHADGVPSPGGATRSPAAVDPAWGAVDRGDAAGSPGDGELAPGAAGPTV
jgi:pilus assembly protein CpaF